MTTLTQEPNPKKRDFVFNIFEKIHDQDLTAAEIVIMDQVENLLYNHVTTNNLRVFAKLLRFMNRKI